LRTPVCGPGEPSAAVERKMADDVIQDLEVVGRGGRGLGGRRLNLEMEFDIRS